ncbi:MAG: glycosyltransferase [Bacteroidota bacterium]|nr:glycosyltransferase [Bacteroidota bacterium]
MNVCFISYQSVMLLKGGPRTQILQTKRELEKLGVNISLYNPWAEFHKTSFDLVHIFGANIGTYHFAREIHKLGVPIVVTPIFFSLHSKTFLRTAMVFDGLLHKSFYGIWTDYGLLAEICSWAKAVLPNTNKEGLLLEKGLNIQKEKLFVVPNGVEERFCNANKSPFINKYGIEDFILNVGHIGPERKNVLRLIHVLQDLNTPAVIIGRIEDNEYGRKCLAEAKKNPRLLILDSIPNNSELLASAYAACDVFVLPSLFETPGIAALEAALAGAKIAITKYGGTDEYFGSYAEYIEPSSAKSIRQGIINVLEKDKQHELQERIRKNFLWEQVAQQTLLAYKSVLTNK